MIRKIITTGTLAAGLCVVLAASASAAANPNSDRKPSVNAQTKAPATLPFNARAQAAADKIVNADQSAITGARSTTMKPIAAVHDPSLLGISITRTGLEISVAGAATAALRRAIDTEADGIPVTIRVVRHSELQLEAVQARIKHDLGYWSKRGIHLSTWGPDLTSDKVSVTLAKYSAGRPRKLPRVTAPAWVAVSTQAVTVKSSSGRTDDFSPWYRGR